VELKAGNPMDLQRNAPSSADGLCFDDPTRAEIFAQTFAEIQQYLKIVDTLPVEALPSGGEIQAILSQFDFDRPMAPEAAVHLVAAAMTSMQTHTSNTRYFGLFNPAATTMGIVGEAFAAAFNSQLAAWSHAPFAVATERYLVQAIGSRFGDRFLHGTFTSGGAEANLTALLCALVARYPSFSNGGLRSLRAQPVVYASAAAHHSVVKASRVLGLGTDALRTVQCDASLGMDIAALREMIAKDRKAGADPLAVVATAGATSSGIVERIPEIAAIAKADELWLHVDAAWGGFAALVPELSPVIAGIDSADSITFDPHKMLSVPMGAGMLLTRHADILARAFAVSADYMPASEDDDRQDPFTHSLQWSRRFIGLKVFLSLSVVGWQGYAVALRRQTMLGNTMRSLLAGSGWKIVNDTPLPVVCFVATTRAESPATIVDSIVRKGNVWISAVVLPDGTPALRACITNFRTSETDVRTLLRELGDG
jgi:glutamate/tyrosine decarboxylase-like PLP-dependent enzyme